MFGDGMVVQSGDYNKELDISFVKHKIMTIKYDGDGEPYL